MSTQTPTRTDIATLDEVQRRVLWLATTIVQHANKARPTQSGIKVGGHQASSASIVSIMTALYFAHLRAEDRVSVKPHAAPVLHAIEYLLGRLDRDRLTTLREFGGLQSYPSRLKDPVPADFSTGSVGIGATAPIWSAIAQRYVAGHFDVPPSGRHISLVGDAELDEGACWEAVIDPMVAQLGEVLWIVDLNRQSLDRVVPDIAIGRVRGMFEAAGWHTVTVKYGSRLEAILSRDGGAALRDRLDTMTNEEYQRLLRQPAATLRHQLLGGQTRRHEIEVAISEIDDTELVRVFRDLGGHDLQLLLDAYAAADAVTDRPSVIFAYTIKAWCLPTEGHPNNHSVILSEDQWTALADHLGANASDPWETLPTDSAAHEVCRLASERLRRDSMVLEPVPRPPRDLGRTHTGASSTQQALGRLLLDLTHTAPAIASRVVTVSPDVASSTNLGGWINRVGVWHLGDRIDWFADDPEMLLRWRENEYGQHIELGIAEVNLVGLLSELGTTWSRSGQPLLPIGTLYDPFVARALEPWSFGIYAGGQSILVGTPSGVTLAPEGGAHQSIVTPSIGLEQPGCIAWEPAYGQDLEWTLLYAMSLLGRPDGSSSYFRLTTRPLNQADAEVPSEPGAREQRRQHVVSGGYRLRASATPPRLTFVGVGATMPEVIAACDLVDGIPSDVVCLTSPDLIFRALQARRGLLDGPDWILDELFPRDRATPIVTVIDGHPHTLSFLGAVRDQPITCLGVTDFGQSGDIDDLYRHFGLDSDTIVGAALDLLD